MAWDAWDNSFVTTKAITQEEDAYDSTLTQFTPGGSEQWERTVTNTQKTIGGLTLAGAEDGSTYIRSTFGDEASVQRQNDAGAYLIRWTAITATPYTQVTTTT
jgi:hypothetical protein